MLLSPWISCRSVSWEWNQNTQSLVTGCSYLAWCLQGPSVLQPVCPVYTGTVPPAWTPRAAPLQALGDGRLVCLHRLAVAIDAAMNTRVQHFV